MTRPIAFATMLALLGAGVPPAGADPLREIPTGRERSTAEVPESDKRSGGSPSANDIIRSLAPFADGNPGARGASPTMRPDDGGPPVQIAPGRSVDLTVFFAHDSADLTPEAMIQLEPLGRALSAPALAGSRFLVAGHTDASGSAIGNRRLSFARAQAVRLHLAERYGIDPDRLRVHGWGATRPRVTGSRRSRVNRRVEISLLSTARTGARSDPPVAIADADGWVNPPCRGLFDPRLGVALDLDDFGASPTRLPCRH